uniref:Uncharacterized protein n=1 Tax=Avena sativa TaxID=4498 RepID=A0ACD6A6H4_AVESA
MSSTLSLPPPKYQGQAGDCRDDKRRRLHQGHSGESGSRIPVEDLENMFSSLAIDSILSKGNSGDCCENRKRKSCQEPDGDLANRLPGDVLENMLSSLAMQDAAVTCSVSGQLGKQGSVLVFSDHNVFSEVNSGDSDSFRSEEFIDRVNNRLLRHEGTGVEVFEVHFDLNSGHAAHLDKWVQFAAMSDAQSVRLHLCKRGISCSGHSVTASRYSFPLHCFGDGQESSLRKLSLTNCIFRPSMHSSSFSSLASLYLMCVTIADSEIQNIFSCFPVLRFLRLERCNGLVNIRISSETLLHLDICEGKKLKSIEIHSASLVFFEYDGHKVDIKYASTPNMRKIVTKFSNRNSSLSKHLNNMKMIEKVTLTFLSPRKEPNFIYAKRFTRLKFVNLYILPSWNNVLAVAHLLQATPYVRRFRLEVRPKCSPIFFLFGVKLECHVGGP